MWCLKHASRLDDAIDAALEVIDKATREQYERTRDVNDKKIQLKCGDVQRRAEVHNMFLLIRNISRCDHR